MKKSSNLVKHVESTSKNIMKRINAAMENQIIIVGSVMRMVLMLKVRWPTTVTAKEITSRQK